jgi:hypothetical protein
VKDWAYFGVVHYRLLDDGMDLKLAFGGHDVEADGVVTEGALIEVGQ